MYLKYFLFSFYNGELMRCEDFETREELKEYLKEEKNIEDLIIIHGWEVKEKDV